MFIEKENYFYIEEFKKYGLTAVYKKNCWKYVWLLPSWKSDKGNTEKKSWKVAGKELNLMDKQEVMAFQTHSNNVKIISEDTTKCYYEKDEYIDGFLTKVKLSYWSLAFRMVWNV